MPIVTPTFLDRLILLPSDALFYLRDYGVWWLAGLLYWYAARKWRLGARLLVPLALTVLLLALASLRWRMVLDAPIMLYVAYLIDCRHYVPYRDIYDINLPGAYLLNILIGRLTGYTDIGLRCADLLYLMLISVCAWQWLRKIGASVGACGVALFALLYLGAGPTMSLQREFLLLLPLGAALYASVALPAQRERERAFLVGLLFGCAATIKPHALVGFPVMAVFLLAESRISPQSAFPRRRLAFLAALLAGGVSIPLVLALLSIWHSGAFGCFVEIVTRLLPIYARLAHGLTPLPPNAWGQYLLRETLSFGGHALWLLPALTGVYVALRHSALDAARKRQIKLLAGLVVAYSLYPLFAGQFYAYHWLPWLFFVAQASALCCLEPLPGANAKRDKIARVLPFAALVLVLALRVRLPADTWTAKPLPPQERADAIAAYLQAHQRPGDTAQPLEYVNGIVHALLIARTPLATPFLTDFWFYPRPDAPYIQTLRQRFLDDLRRTRPRYILRSDEKKLWPGGGDTLRAFPELAQLLASDYRVAFKDTRLQYTIYERVAKR